MPRSSTPERKQARDAVAKAASLRDNGGSATCARCDCQGSPKSAKPGSNQYSRPPCRSSSRNHSSKLRAMIRGGLRAASSPEVKIG